MTKRLFQFILVLLVAFVTVFVQPAQPGSAAKNAIGTRSADPGPFLNWPLPTSITIDSISRLPDSKFTHNFLGITDCPGYPALIDAGKWYDGSSAGGNRNSILPGVPDSQVKWLNGNDGAFFSNAFACYGGHAGTDIFASNGTDITAAAYADQITVNLSSHRITLRHPNVNGTGQTWYTYYVHITSSTYSSGTTTPENGIPVGKVIGKVGSGHLHFQVDNKGGYWDANALNPFGIDQAPWTGCLFLNSQYCTKTRNPVPFVNGHSRLFFDNNGDRINLEVCADNLANRPVVAKLWRDNRWWTLSAVAGGSCLTFWDMDGVGPVLTDRPYRAWASLEVAPDTNWPVHCYNASNQFGLCNQAQYPSEDVDPVFVSNCDGGEGVYLYELTNYQGKCQKFTGDAPRSDDWVVGNDSASSMKLIGSYKATLYQHVDYQGIASIFTADDPDLTNDAVGNDQTSSIRVQKVTTYTYNNIKARHSGRCMDVYGGSYDPGANVIQWDCHNGNNQAWQLVPLGNNYYEIVVKRTGFCLDVAGGSKDAGVQLIQWPCHGGPNQLFKKVAVGSYFQLVAQHSSMCLDVYGGWTDNGARVIQWPCHSGFNQQWSIEGRPASLVEPIDDPSVNESILKLASTGYSSLVTHTIQEDESLDMIAGYYDTTVDNLLAVNPDLVDITDINPGMTITVPTKLVDQPVPAHSLIFLPFLSH